MTKSAVLIGIGVGVLMTAGSAAASVSVVYSPNRFTTVHSATFTLKGVNGTMYPSSDWTPVTLTGPETYLNPPGATPTSSLPVTLSGSRGTLEWEIAHRETTVAIPGGPTIVQNRDGFGFRWIYSNTGQVYTADFNVTFTQSVVLKSGASAYTQNPNWLTVSSDNGATFSAFNRDDTLTVGTYTFRFEQNLLTLGGTSGSTFGLFFESLAAPVPGSGLAAVGSLGLAGLARRRRR